MLKIGANLRTEREEKHYCHLRVRSVRSVWDHLTSKSNTRFGHTIPPVAPEMLRLLLALQSKLTTTIYSLSRLLKRFNIWFSAIVKCTEVVHGLDFPEVALTNWLSATLAIWALVELPTSELSQASVARLSCAFERRRKRQHRGSMKCEICRPFPLI